MKRRKVIIAPEVAEQITSQVLYIAKDSIDNALDWEDRLHIAIAALGTATGHAVDESASDRLGFRIHRLVFESNYLVHYHVEAQAGRVRIVNFRHVARLPRKGEP